MYEPIFNVFLYVEEGSIRSIGIVAHSRDGSDGDKISFLQSRVNTDCHIASRFRIDPPLMWKQYEAMMRIGRHLEVFEAAMQSLNAPRSPIMVITPIVSGRPSITAITDLGPINLKQLEQIGQQGVMLDYLKEYSVEGALDIPRMLDDDYFQSIKLLFNAGKYVSASKLLMSLIDTLAFVEHGDAPQNFTRWLDEYADLLSIGITSTELWEFRNALLHMTNLESRKVLAGVVPRLVPFVGQMPPGVSVDTDSHKHFSLLQLIDVIIKAISVWIATYNDDRDKFVNFVARYDTVLSDARLAVFRVER